MFKILSKGVCARFAPKRRWLQFTTRGGLAALTIFCVWLGSVVKATQRQARAVARIRELGGSVGYNTPNPYEDLAGFGPLPPRELAWHERWFGEEYFRRVISAKLELWKCHIWGDDDLVVLRDLPDLKELCLESNVGFTDAGLKNLRDLKRMEILSLQSNEITGSGLRWLGRMKQLRSLTLVSGGVHDVGFSELPLLPKLRELTLAETHTTDESLARLANFANLERLELDGTGLFDEGLSKLASLKRLNYLSIRYTNVSRQAVGRFRRMASACEVAETASDRAPLPDLCALPKDRTVDSWELEPILRRCGFGFEVKFSEDRVAVGGDDPYSPSSVTFRADVEFASGDGVAIKEIEPRRPQIDMLETNSFDLRLSAAEFNSLLMHLPMLTRLYLHDSQFTDKMADAVSRVSPQLLELDLSNDWITDHGLQSLGNLPKLTHLWVSENQITDDGIRRLANGGQLRVLCLRSTKITDAGCESLGRFANLFSLDIGDTAITDQGIERLAPLRKLKTLSITGTSVSDASVPVLAGLTQLTELEVSATKLTTDGVAELRRRLPFCAVLSDNAPIR